MAYLYQGLEVDWTGLLTNPTCVVKVSQFTSVGETNHITHICTLYSTVHLVRDRVMRKVWFANLLYIFAILHRGARIFLYLCSGEPRLALTRTQFWNAQMSISVKLDLLMPLKNLLFPLHNPSGLRHANALRHRSLMGLNLACVTSSAGKVEPCISMMALYILLINAL